MDKKNLVIVLFLIFIVPLVVILVAYYSGSLRSSLDYKDKEKGLSAEISRHEKMIERKGASPENYLEAGKRVIKENIDGAKGWKLPDSTTYNPVDVGIYLLNKAVSLDPNSQEAHYWLGVAYQKHEGPMIENQIPYYPEYVELASEHFKTALEISPSYKGEINVLGPYSKLTSVWGSLALRYINEDKPDSVVWAFERGAQEGAFNKYQRQFARNLLNSCGGEAILFTNGDVDTYPLMYLQWVEGFRKDVRIANLSLLNTVWFIKHLKHRRGVDIALSDEEIEKLRPRREGGDIIRIQDIMMKHIIDNAEMVEIADSEYAYSPPIYFSITVAMDNKEEFKNFLSLEGLVFRLVATEGETQRNWGKLRENLFEVYDYDGLTDTTLTRYSSSVALQRNYAVIFMILANQQVEDGTLAEAILTLEYARNVLPYDSGRNTRLVDLYLDSSEEVEAEKTFAEAMEVDSANPYIYPAYGEIFIKHGMREKGMEILNKGHKLFPADNGNFITLEYYLHEYGPEEEYKRLLKEWIKLHPEDKDLYEPLLEREE
ncbi:hypothetical protein JXI42_03580 [bacterium]|nr:hypothetical protein [bacterium]